MDKYAERYERGMAVRRQLFGRRDSKPRPPSVIQKLRPEFMELLTEFAFGEVWSRPGLDFRTRSFITVSALIALGRWEELRLHMRAALRNGLTKDEITEMIMHLGLYAGLPVSVSSFHIARRGVRGVGHRAGRI
jgi:alkylhydroperoxidase/carboxymuconolactone decarboxylase family protein YurZ